MATLRDIKNRIKGVKSTQQITKAMKMVAAARLRRAQENVLNARPYARNIWQTLSHLATENDLKTNPFFVQREIKKIACVIVTADRGLCGAFNSNLIKEAVRFIDDERGNNHDRVHLFCVGKKGFDFFSKRNYNVYYKNIGLFSSLKYSESLSITNALLSAYLDGTFDKVVIIYNEFKSIIQQKITIEQFLPITLVREKNVNNNQSNYIFEPDQKSIFEYMLPKHLKAQIWRILLESNASELGARMTAMDNASTNAKELIRTLQLKYNKERQAAITKELLEIVAGANALQAN
ncbi:MAG: ATP synthase F1 subunit gamma [Ignavibacteriaceae bacterium]|nr:ATP synthase F1 subunit gamma [Ignavibacteriaceae bacterium]